MTGQRLIRILLVCSWALLMGAEGDDCMPDQPCDLACDFYKTDSAGRTYCECKPSDMCILLLPPPARNPSTGECVEFPTVCDVPTGWPACEGCTYEGVSYAPGESFPASDGCNTCSCSAGGAIACTEMACIDPCWGAWLDQNGICRTPADGVYPEHCCSNAGACATNTDCVP